MTQEELKTCLGQLMLDLRGNWAFNYVDRLYIAKSLCSQIEDDTARVERAIDCELNSDGDFDGRIFRGLPLYGYKSDYGKTEGVKQWILDNLSYPELCDFV